jgi:hypothetical protein
VLIKNQWYYFSIGFINTQGGFTYGDYIYFPALSIKGIPELFGLVGKITNVVLGEPASLL